MIKKIVLMGYMGSGKSTVGKILAKNTDFINIDLDNLIEHEEKKSIKKIFEIKGEIFFRKLEHQNLKKLLLSDEKKYIISLGGGTPCYSNNIELLKNSDCVTIYLKRSVDYLFENLIKKKSKRPLIANLSELELKEYIAKHLFERNFYYNQANIILNAENKSKKEIVADIKNTLLL